MSGVVESRLRLSDRRSVNCLGCKKRLMQPDGDVSICVWCGKVTIVEDGVHRNPSAVELAAIERTSEYRMAMAVVMDFDTPLVEDDNPLTQE